MDSNRLDDIATRLIAKLPVACGDDLRFTLPNRETMAELCRRMLALLFPGFFTKAHLFCGHVDTFTRQLLLEVEDLLRRQVALAARFDLHHRGTAIPDDLDRQVDRQLAQFFDDLPTIAELVASDVQAAFDNDPAAASRQEIIAAYPGLEAIAVQRLAHALYRLQVPLVPRMMTEVAHSHTGIDIHPGATIGAFFAIDHGTGIVIGETCTIGEHCMLYHGVTLGAFNPLAKGDDGTLTRGSDNKRHPDLEHHVRVYPGATILGGDTRVGHHSVIGGNVWLTQSVEAYSKVTMKDPELMVRSANAPSPGADFSI